MYTKRLGNMLNLAICIASICFLLVYPGYCIDAAKDGLSTALYIVLPSIFPFMVLARFIVSSGLHNILSRFVGKYFENIFGICRKYASVFILGCLGGYPIGAIALNSLLKRNEISREQAQHLVGICNNASPMFVIGTIGTLMLNNTFYGYVLFLIHLSCVFLCGIIMKFTFHPNSSGYVYCKQNPKSNSPLSDAITSSGTNMVNIASYIIIFSVISKFVQLVFKDFNCSFVLCILEITTGIKYCISSNIPEITKLSLISSALGFSGLCVFMQSRSVFEDLEISFSKYFFAKSLIAILSFIISYIVFTIIFSY